MSELKPTCCGVTFNRGWPSKCSKAAKAEVEGRHYCSIHNPIAIAEKNAIKNAALKAKHDAIDAARAENKAKQAELERRADCYTELLEACKKALYALKGRENDQFLRDAIAKATGEQA